jgi:hypothetical protein
MKSRFVIYRKPWGCLISQQSHLLVLRSFAFACCHYHFSLPVFVVEKPSDSVINRATVNLDT